LFSKNVTLTVFISGGIEAPLNLMEQELKSATIKRKYNFFIINPSSLN